MDTRVGGLYGVSIGRMFFGESMSSKSTNASKVGLFHLAEKLKNLGFGPIDCQMMNSHIETLGAVPMSREEFGAVLNQYLRAGETKKVLGQSNNATNYIIFRTSQTLG